jgi:adenine-specific DNA-methyltransferase
LALLEQLLKDIDDADLREQIEAEVKRLKAEMTFGLVFEKHLPESVMLASGVGLRVGDEVRQRSRFEDSRRLRVQKITGKKAAVARLRERAIQQTSHRKQAIVQRDVAGRN